MFCTRSQLIAILAALSAMSLCFLHAGPAVGQATATAAKPDSRPGDDKAPFGIDRRIPWTTSRFRGTPDPPLPYRAERVFPRLHFKSPTVLTSAPGTDRLFVAEQYGKLFSIPNNPGTAAADLFLDATTLVPRLAAERKEDLEFEAVYGLAFHPQFADNRYCYVCYVVHYRDNKLGQHPAGTRVSRFTVSRTDPPRCDPSSEKPIISWLQGGHNGGCLKFGPEGYLYISSGDGGPAFPPDPLKAGQDVTNVLSAIMRVDVDREQAGRAYAIPQDNPFVDLKDARGEVWAYGLRNPWRMSFDRKTGELWCADVGQNLYEEVDIIQKGGNYGWSRREGFHPFGAKGTGVKKEFIEPIWEYHHDVGKSMTGGTVYRGKQFPELEGHYVHADYVTSKIWAIKYDEKAKRVTANRSIKDPAKPVLSFGEDEQGELYFLVVAPNGRGIYRFVKQ